MLLILLISLVPAVWSQSQCNYTADVYFVKTNRCYNFNVRRLAWNNALIFCQNINYDLVSIHSEEENNFIIENARKKLKKDRFGRDLFFWAGGNRLQEDLHYNWSDGSSFNYEHWEDGQPVKDNMYVEINTSKWNTYDDYEAMQFVCGGPSLVPAPTGLYTTGETTPVMTTQQVTTTPLPPTTTSLSQKTMNIEYVTFLTCIGVAFARADML